MTRQEDLEARVLAFVEEGDALQAEADLQRSMPVGPEREAMRRERAAAVAVMTDRAWELIEEIRGLPPEVRNFEELLRIGVTLSLKFPKHEREDGK
ncbi:MAG TPA: hypothetical protein VJB57_04085 [Dehalococcoidia bacterium]|nr:hypothetical protein [Dehalococcoidia bacterium]